MITVHEAFFFKLKYCVISSDSEKSIHGYSTVIGMCIDLSLRSR
jgi:hypothetical protein